MLPGWPMAAGQRAKQQRRANILGPCPTAPPAPRARAQRGTGLAACCASPWALPPAGSPWPSTPCTRRTAARRPCPWWPAAVPASAAGSACARSAAREGGQGQGQQGCVGAGTGGCAEERAAAGAAGPAAFKPAAHHAAAACAGRHEAVVLALNIPADAAEVVGRDWRRGAAGAGGGVGQAAAQGPAPSAAKLASSPLHLLAVGQQGSGGAGAAGCRAGDEPWLVAMPRCPTMPAVCSVAWDGGGPGQQREACCRAAL